MGVTKLILLGVVLGTGVVGLDRVLVMTTGDKGHPVQAASIAAAMPASQAAPSVTRVPLVGSRQAAPMPSEFQMVFPEPGFVAGPSAGEPLKLALGRVDSRRATYRVMRLECESRPDCLEVMTRERVRESLEARGL